MKPRLLLRLQTTLRSLSRLSFTDSLVLIFLILGTLWLLRFVVTSARGQDLSRIGFVNSGDPSAASARDAGRQFAAVKVASLKVNPVRAIDGVQENISAAPGWCHFFGTVTAVLPDGINVNGFYGPVAGTFLQSEETTFFVTHFPFDLAEGDKIAMTDWQVAKDIGVYTFKSPFKGPRGLHHLDYGQPVLPHRPDQAELAAVLAQARKDRSEMDALMLARAPTNQVATNSLALRPTPAN